MKSEKKRKIMKGPDRQIVGQTDKWMDGCMQNDRQSNVFLCDFFSLRRASCSSRDNFLDAYLHFFFANRIKTGPELPCRLHRILISLFTFENVEWNNGQVH